MVSRGWSWFQDRKLDAELWCDGRAPWLRAALLAYLIYGGVRHLLDPTYRTWFAGITLAFHELGHVVFTPLGYTLGLLGGSLMQIIVPLAAAIYLVLRQGDYFGLAVGQSWLAFSLWELALYISDAAREELALVGFSDRPEHDWSALLTRWHLLNSCDTIAFVVRAIATVTWLTAMGLGAWLCWRLWSGQRHA
ncbi:MAG: hypothetical protein JRI68_27650 [Deltaproteobacteria bacterium]|nr:hypothetical protein [Deltaproteobacteria bacterium]